MQYQVLYFRPSPSSQSPVEKEYHKEVQQPKERAKIDAVLKNIETFGLQSPGVTFEKVKGIKGTLFELKIKAFGSEHRFLSTHAPFRTLEGTQILVLLKYIKKKEWKLKRTDIETALQRLMWVEGGSYGS